MVDSNTNHDVFFCESFYGMRDNNFIPMQSFEIRMLACIFIIYPV